MNNKYYYFFQSVLLFSTSNIEASASITLGKWAMVQSKGNLEKAKIVVLNFSTVEYISIEIHFLNLWLFCTKRKMHCNSLS